MYLDLLNLHPAIQVRQFRRTRNDFTFSSFVTTTMIFGRNGSTRSPCIEAHTANNLIYSLRLGPVAFLKLLNKQFFTKIKTKKKKKKKRAWKKNTRNIGSVSTVNPSINDRSSSDAILADSLRSSFPNNK